MAEQTRTIRVWASLVASMTIGAVVLMTLDKQSPQSAAAFSLTSLRSLDSIDNVLQTRESITPGRWNSIEVFYSNSKGGDIESLARAAGLSKADDINTHFVICNGAGGKDGMITSSRKWNRQLPCLSENGSYSISNTLRICVVGDGFESMPTDCQIKRVESLVESLCRMCQIESVRVAYPAGWQM